MDKKSLKRVIKIFSHPQAVLTCGACASGEHYNGTDNTYLRNMNQGCCFNCGDMAGYLGSHYTVEDINKIKEDFNFLPSSTQNHNRTGPRYSNGFWDKEKGCKLPVEIRSDTCNTFACHQLSSALLLSEETQKFLHKAYSSRLRNYTHKP